jgi:hypothetical protein
VKARLSLGFFAIGLAGGLAAASCSGTGLCDNVQCGLGLVCDGKTGLCKRVGGPGGDDGGQPAGGDGGAVGCQPGCTALAPVCDTTNGVCRVCTATDGCGGLNPICDSSAGNGLGACITCTHDAGCRAPTPFCDGAVIGGACIQCRTSADCVGVPCDPVEHICGSRPVPDGGGGDGGVAFIDGGSPGPCLGLDAGNSPCNGIECGRGFTCEAGQCVLNGASGPVQVTLRWNQPEDLDLHVVEPLPNGGNCEIWYGDPNRDGGSPSSCGAMGSLDLDSNPACSIDNVDTENVIYPSGPAPHGTYTVRVDYYQQCTATTPVPYQVKVRANGQVAYFCGAFLPTQSDQGGLGSGVTVTTFTVP